MTTDDTSKIDSPSPDPDRVPTAYDMLKAVQDIKCRLFQLSEQLHYWYAYRSPSGEHPEERYLVEVLDIFLYEPLGAYADYLEERASAEYFARARELGIDVYRLRERAAADLAELVANAHQ